ncbi:MAG: FAD-binding protein [Bacteroidia bacterium]|nr:FAD-binding protein [Bacteroidia bacterium]
MQTKLQLQLSPETALNEQLLKEEIRQQLSLNRNAALQLKILKRSIDARGRNIKINVTLIAAVDEQIPEDTERFVYQDVSSAKHTCHIIGAGPAGLFAALRCIELGIKPIVVERGKDIKARRRDLAAINKEQRVNPESNYCFGEGGAGTYSDGKLYTRSNKRGDVDRILKILVQHGATNEILIDAHPHIGTNKLPQLIQNIRETIIASGGEIHFNTKLCDFEIKENKIKAIQLLCEGSEKTMPVQQVILATGHSARDIYELLHSKNILLEAKPFALGVRAEHPQELIDSIQYHCGSLQEVLSKREYLPAASYSLVHQVKGRGVYSFCMCPGGIIAPCATEQKEVVTNGWSPSKRNNPYANSGIVVGLDLKDFEAYKHRGPLAGLYFQKEIEQRAWEWGGKTQTAPAQRLLDFTNARNSATLPDCSYQPGIRSVDMQQVLGKLIGPALKEGFKGFGTKMRGYLTNEAVIVGVESRTSTPVRIPRDKEKFNHPQINNLYPCGEGAGFAGGIVSAAMDGENCATALRY